MRQQVLLLLSGTRSNCDAGLPSPLNQANWRYLPNPISPIEVAGGSLRMVSMQPAIKPRRSVRTSARSKSRRDSSRRPRRRGRPSTRPFRGLGRQGARRSRPSWTSACRCGFPRPARRLVRYCHCPVVCLDNIFIIGRRPTSRNPFEQGRPHEAAQTASLVGLPLAHPAQRKYESTDHREFRTDGDIDDRLLPSAAFAIAQNTEGKRILHHPFQNWQRDSSLP